MDILHLVINLGYLDYINDILFILFGLGSIAYWLFIWAYWIGLETLFPLVICIINVSLLIDMNFGPTIWMKFVGWVEYLIWVGTIVVYIKLDLNYEILNLGLVEFILICPILVLIDCASILVINWEILQYGYGMRIFMLSYIC